MRAFDEAYPDEAIVQQDVGQIPWGYNVILLDKLSNLEERLWSEERGGFSPWQTREQLGLSMM